MPVFECARCNALSYSSSPSNVAPCSGCGAERRRLVENAASFAEARTVPRAISIGDHSLVIFDDEADVAAMASEFIDQAVLADGLVMAAVPQTLEDRILEHLHPDDAVWVAWELPSDTYGPGFDPDAIVQRFREISALEERPIFVLGCADQPVQDFTNLESWERYERLAHETAVECGITVMCLYDARLHDANMLQAGLRSHGLVEQDGELRRNDTFDYEPPS